MDKNTITGFLLIAAVVIGFTIFTKPNEEQIAQQKHYQDSIALVNAQLAEKTKSVESKVEDASKPEKSIDGFFAPSTTVVDTLHSTTENVDSVQAKIEAKEEIISLENEKIKIDFSTKGGQMVKSQLKGYKRFDGDSLYLFNQDANFSLLLENKNGVVLDTKDAIFTPIKGNEGSGIKMRLNYSENKYIDFIYTLEPNSYMVKFNIEAVGMKDILNRQSSAEKFELVWQQSLKHQEKSISGEQRYSRIYYKHLNDNVEEMSETKDDKIEVSNPVKWVAFKNQFFASVIIADYNFDISQLSSKVRSSGEYLKDYEARLFVPVTTENDGTLKAGFRYFMGPLDYSMLQSYDDDVKDQTQILDMDKMIPLGWTLFRWMNQYFIIPLFNLLSSTGWNMGLVILLLTVIVKLLISPLTYKSFMSSAKMRVLRPQIEELNAKFPKQDQMKERQQATMALYGKAGVNPMSGCIPMLLQMPILLALFSFFPSAIELRQQGFLWADDLSTYDAIITWSGDIPLVTKWLGNHISLFCILMTITNIVYTKFNMDATNTGQQQMPGMKWMMYLMPVVFLFVLNNYPSGLTFYYFLSTLITILLTIGFRYAIDEEKLLAKLEENKKKPKKKSGFMARLEEAQRLQQQQAKSKAKAPAKKKK